MENCPNTGVLPEKGIDKPMGAYYNVLAVTDIGADESAHIEM
jgi:hypothetical protein